MRFKVEVFLALAFGGLALTGLILPILGYIFLGLATAVLVDIVAGKIGYETRLISPITFRHKRKEALLDARMNTIIPPTSKVDLAPLIENKLALVAKAIMGARTIVPAGKDINVYITDANGLTRLYSQELKDILVKLQDDERIIMLKSFPEWMLPYEKFTKEIYNSKVRATLDPSKKHFVVTVLANFDNWYKANLPLTPDKGESQNQ